MKKKNVLLTHPEDNRLKFLFTCYDINDLSMNARDNAVKDNLLMKNENENTEIIILEKEYIDINESLQKILKTEIGADEESTVLYRTFFISDGGTLIPEKEIEVCALADDDFITWKQNKIDKNKLN